MDDTVAPRHRFRIVRKLARHRSFSIGFVIMAVMLIIAIAAPYITGLDPTAMKIRRKVPIGSAPISSAAIC